MKKRWLSLILALCMVLSLFPFSAFAESETGEGSYDEEVTAAAEDTSDFWAEADEADRYISPGESCVLSVNVSDEELVTACQWQIWNAEDGEWNDLAGEDWLSLELNNINQNSKYRCTVSCGDRSEDVDFSVWLENDFYAFTNGNTDFNVRIGDTVTMDVDFYTDGDPALVTFQWYVLQLEGDDEGDETEDWAAIPGAVENSYTTDPIQDCTRYRCVVSDGYGNEDEVYYYVYIDNYYYLDAEGDTWRYVSLGSTAELTVVPNGYDLSGVTYQWYHLEEVTHVDDDDEGESWTETTWVRIPGATEPTYRTDEITSQQEYCCEAIDRFQNNASCNFTVCPDNHLQLSAVGDPDVAVAPGERASLQVSVSADDLSGVTLQWWKVDTNGDWTELEGETGETYLTAPVDGACRYVCQAVDTYGSAQEVWFSVRVDNGFYAERVGEEWRNVAPGEATELAVEAGVNDGTEITYQWYRWTDDGWSAIAGAAGASYTAAVTEYTEFYCRVQGAYGAEAQIYFYLDIDNAFSAWAEGGQDVFAPIGEPVELTVSVSGNVLDRVTYSWQRLETLEDDGETYDNWVELEGETDSTLTTGPITGAVRYRCIVRDGYGSNRRVSFDVAPENHLTVTAENTDVRIAPEASATLRVTVSADDMEGMKLQWWGTREVVHEGENGDPSYTSTDWVLLAEDTDEFETGSLTASADYLFRATDRFGTVQECWINVYVDNRFSLQPVGSDTVTVKANEWVDLEVEVSGIKLDKVTYQWYHLVTNEEVGDDGNIYTNEYRYPLNGETGTRCSVTATAGREQYICEAKDGYGNSSEVWFNVAVENHFDAKCKDDVWEIYVSPGESVDLQVEVTCDDPSGLTYTWGRYNFHTDIQDDGRWEHYGTREDLDAVSDTCTTGPVENFVNYFCDVEDGYGNSERVEFYVRVQNNFDLTRGDDSDNYYVPYGESTVLHTRVRGNDTSDVLYKWSRITYYWQTDENGELQRHNTWDDVSNETGSSLAVSNVTEYAQYYCEAIDRFGNTDGYWFNVYVDNHFSARPAGGNGTVAVNAGEPARLQIEVSADNLDGMTYRWFEEKAYEHYEADGSTWTEWQTNALPDVTGDSYTIENIDGRANYYCTVTDAFGNNTDVWFYVRVNNPFTAEPLNGVSEFRVPRGDSLTLKVDVRGDNIYDARYQWYFVERTERIGSNGQPNEEYTTHILYGATESSYTVDSVNRNGRYYCRVTDRYGNARDCWFYVYVDNGFTANYVGSSTKQVPYGGTIDLQVEASTNDGSALTYRWFLQTQEKHVEENGDWWYENFYTLIDGADTDTLTVGPVNERSMYYCHVTDAYGNAGDIHYEVNVDNHFYVNAVDASERYVSPGETATLQVKAYGDDLDGVTYQWRQQKRFEETNAYGETYSYYRTVTLDNNTDTLITEPVTDHQEYWCDVTDRFGNSSSCWFSVYVENHFTVKAEGNTEVFAAPGNTAELAVTAAADDMEKITYQWYRFRLDADDPSVPGSYWTPVSGANGNALTTDAITKYERYYCTVSDGYGNSRSVFFNISVENHFTVKAEGNTEVFAAPGSTAELAVTAAADDMEQITYQWYRLDANDPSAPGGSWTPVSGANGNALTTDAITKYERYSCTVSDGYGNSRSVFFNISVENHFTVEPVGAVTLYPRPNEELTLAVDAHADQGPLTFRWYWEGNMPHTEEDGSISYYWDSGIVEGADSDSLTVTADWYGMRYRCAVTDPYGAQKEIQFYIYLNNEFSVRATGGGEPILVEYGKTTELAVDVSAYDASRVSCQWMKYVTETHTDDDGSTWESGTMVPVDGATGRTFITDPVTKFQRYSCYVQDGYGNSRQVWISVSVDNGFQVQRVSTENTTASAGDTVTLQVSASVNDGSTLTYDWCAWTRERVITNDGHIYYTGYYYELPDVTGDTFTYQFNGDTMYRDVECVVRDEYGNYKTLYFWVNVDNGLTAEAVGGSDVYVPYGGSAVLEVSAAAKDETDMAYLWYSEEQVTYTEPGGSWTQAERTWIRTDNSPVLALDDVTACGKYVCVAVDRYGSRQEVPFSVNLARITEQPEDYLGEVGDLVTASVSVESTLDLNYQWQLGDGEFWADLPGENSPTCQITLTEDMDMHYLRCVITNEDAGLKLISNEIVLSALLPTTISEQPQDFTGRVGDEAAFFVDIAGKRLPPQAFHWQWSEDGETWNSFDGYGQELILQITDQDIGHWYRCVITDAYGQQLISEPAQLHLGAITIQQQPRDFRGQPGDTATFLVRAKGDNLSYQWQFSDDDGETWKNSSTNKTAVATCAVTEARDGRLYRCVITDANGNSVTTVSVRVYAYPITILAQPEDYSGLVGDTATFAVAAEGSGLTYQWEYSDNNGKTWTQSSSQTETATCKITAKRDGRLYRCVITDESGFTLTSAAAKIVVLPILITAQPQNYTGPAGDTATFRIAAEGNGLTYQWQYSNDNGASWILSNSKTDSATCKITAARDGRLYRCVITDAAGNELISDIAKLTVTQITITAQPQDYTGPVGDTAAFTVQAEGSGLSYQWEYSDDNGASWTTSTYKTETATCKITANRDGRLYRCVITDAGGNTLTSAAAELHAISIRFTAQPQDYTGPVGDTATFTVRAEGSGLSYQWEFSDDNGASWTASNYKTETATCKISANRDGRLYRCVVTDANGYQLTSETAKLTVLPITITQQPADYVGRAGDTAAFTVQAEGSGLSYQWEFSDDNGASWTASTSKTETATCKINANRDGRLYRCVISDANGCQLISETAKLVVLPLAITRQPADYTGPVGDTAAFTVQAEGSDLSYQWQFSDDDGASWTTSNAKTETATCKITAARDGRLYRCVITDANGHQLISETAKIVIAPIVITAQPQDFSGAPGDTAIFEIAAKGNGLTYQWEFSDSNGAKWTVSSSNKSEIAVCQILASRDGRLYRCVVTDSSGNTLVSDAAKITVIPIKITVQPADYTGDVGDSAVFAIAAQGNLLTYQWEYSDDNGATWSKSSSTGFSASCKITKARDGRLYRCVVTDGGGYSVTTEAAKVIYAPSPIKITEQPKDYSGAVGGTATFTVLAEGNGLTYRWQFTDDGVNWLTSSSKTATATCGITAARDGRLYRCIITDADGNTHMTAIAKLTVQ